MKDDRVLRDRELTDGEIAWMFEKKDELDRELIRLRAEHEAKRAVRFGERLREIISAASGYRDDDDSRDMLVIAENDLSAVADAIDQDASAIRKEIVCLLDILKAVQLDRPYLTSETAAEVEAALHAASSGLRADEGDIG